MENRVKKFPDRKGVPPSPDNGKTLPNPGEGPESKKAEPIPPPGGDKRPAGRQVIDISEVTFLRFEATKLNESLIVMERAKLKAEERLIKVSQNLLELRAEQHDAKSLEIYKRLGIEVGDKLLETDKGFKIVRGGVKKT